MGKVIQALREFSKIADHTVNTQKSKTFLSTNKHQVKYIMDENIHICQQ